MRALVTAALILWISTLSEEYIEPERSRSSLLDDQSVRGVGIFRRLQQSRRWKPIGQYPTSRRSWKKFTASYISRDGKCVAVSGRYRNSDKLEIKSIIDGATLRRKGNPIYPKQKDDDSQNTWGIDNGAIALSANCDYVALGSTSTVSGRRLGAVRVYKYDNRINKWRQIGRDITGSQEFEDFAERISMSDDGTRVATCGEDWKKSTGRCRVFELTGQDWKQIGQTLTGGVNGVKNMGDTLRLSGNGQVFATQGEDEGKNGFVYVYELEKSGSTFRWRRRDGITRFGSEGLFGYSLSISQNGDYLAVGAPAFDGRGQKDDKGRVRVFRWNESSSRYKAFGRPITGKIEDACGDSVSISSNGLRLAVGCDEKGFKESTNDQFGSSTTGYVKVFDYNESNRKWVQVGWSIRGAEKEYLGKRERIALSGDGSLLFISSPRRARLFQEP